MVGEFENVPRQPGVITVGSGDGDDVVPGVGGGVGGEQDSGVVAPGAESTYNNQPNGDLSELTKKTAPAGSAFRATSGVSSATVQLVALGSRVRTSRR